MITANQIERQLEKLTPIEGARNVVAFSQTQAWEGPSEVSTNSEAVPIHYCGSTLEIIDQLNDNDGPIVILTPVPQRELPNDLLARLTKNRLLQLDRSQLILEAFGARRLDPRFPTSNVMLEALLRSAPKRALPNSRAALSLDEAWGAILQHYLGIDETLISILTASVNPQWIVRLRAMEDELLVNVLDRLKYVLGSVGSAISSCLRAGHSEDLLPLGLVVELLSQENENDRALTMQITTRLEHHLGGHHLRRAEAEAWHREATVALRKLDANAQIDTTERAESLLMSVKGLELAGLSQILPSGFQARKRQVAQRIDELVRRGNSKNAQLAIDRLKNHWLSSTNPGVIARLEKALCLARYLQRDYDTDPSTLVEAVLRHIHHDAFADWARRALAGGDEDSEVSACFSRLVQSATTIRENNNRQFAHQLALVHEADHFERPIVPIESFLGVLQATAKHQNVLLLVLDGMDASCLEELASDLHVHGWSRWERRDCIALISAVPSVTEHSRKALFTGDLSAGAAVTEKREFERNAELGPANTKLPVLFHKGGLEDAAAEGISPRVRKAIADPQQRIAAVVLNAVDDHLAKSDQVRLSWTIEQFRHLDSLLAEAQQAERAVIITSDHGHVLEAGSELLDGGTRGRWRPYDESITKPEIEIRGPRIKRTTGEDAIVALWSERARYGRRDTGYHGGVAPQEVVVPLAAFTKGLRELDGWVPRPEPRPSWWRRMGSESHPLSNSKPENTKVREAKDSLQQSLFDAPMAADDWIGELLGSSIFQEQYTLAARTAPSSEVISKTIRLLEENSGRLGVRKLAQDLGLLEMRMRGLIAGLQRILNVDGYAVVELEEQSQTLKLDRDLLFQQFNL